VVPGFVEVSHIVSSRGYMWILLSLWLAFMQTQSISVEDDLKGGDVRSKNARQGEGIGVDCHPCIRCYLSRVLDFEIRQAEELHDDGPWARIFSPYGLLAAILGF
jgi:hypothetical protein